MNEQGQNEFETEEITRVDHSTSQDVVASYRAMVLTAEGSIHANHAAWLRANGFRSN